MHRAAKRKVGSGANKTLGALILVLKLGGGAMAELVLDSEKKYQNSLKVPTKPLFKQKIYF